MRCLMRANNKYYFLCTFFVLFFCFNNNSFAAISSLDFKYHSLSDDTVQVVIPFPSGQLDTKSVVQLRHNQEVLDTSVVYHLLWPGTSKVRALAVEFKPVIGLGSYQLLWRSSAFELDKGVFNTNIIDVEFEREWLSQLAYGKVASSHFNNDWFQNSYSRFAEYVTSPGLIDKNKKQKLTYNDAAPWLYDHPFALYMLYLRTGELHWKKLAHKMSQKYVNNINSDGFFKLKSTPDVKYLMSAGLVLDYMFYPKKRTVDVVKNMFKNTLPWRAKYDRSYTFWTERNLSNAIMLPLSLWELTDSKQALSRLKKVIHESKGNLKQVQEGACMAHEFRDHEGKGGDSLVCSPWMSALVVEQLWRYYVLTSDGDAAEIITLLADFAASSGLYKGTRGHLLDLTIPMYLTYVDNSAKKNRFEPWTDIQHACDVAGMILKGQYVKKKIGLEHSFGREQVTGLLKTCKKTLARSKKVKVWHISPLRKFNWWFSSTANLEWLLTELDY